MSDRPVETIACLGSNTTASKGTYKWIDELAKRLSNGWQFHVDGIHLNTRGGRILAEVVQQFLDT
ncbi:MAG TPA: hypothetical protein VN741_09850 [Mycobacterium sp.]|nr:hypothetical protein [Mycobacterium sp.]